MLEIEGLSKSFDTHDILKNVNLTVDTGQRATIIGPSGSGKSTILKLILGLISADTGNIILNGVNLKN